jgi:iron complex outermembrane receptor protein
MKKRILIAGVSCLLCLGVNGVVCGADDTSSPSNQASVQNEQPPAEGLQLFMEDQDLVSATKRPITIRKAPAIATIISAEEIKNMGANSLLDVLKMVPGFGVSINEYNSMMVEVRGIRSTISEKILVMIDGHSLNRNINGSSLYRTVGYFPLDNVRQVEIIRGPGSALYGNSAFVATINIITRNAEEINGFEAKIGGGSFDSFKENLVGGNAIGDKLTISGTVDHYQTNGPKLTVGADTLSGTPFTKTPGPADLYLNQTDAFLKVGYGDLSFRGNYHTKEQGMNVGIVAALTDDSSRTQIDNYWGELAYNLRLADNLTANIKLTYDYYEQDPTMKIYPDGFRGLFPDGMIGKPLVKDRTLGGELQVDWDMFKGNHLIAGVSFEEMKQSDVKQLANFNPATGAPLGSVQEVANWNKDATRQVYATYLQDEWQLPAHVNLTAGVRYDHYSDFGDTVNPRAGLVWSFLENADLKLLYGQAFRGPNFVELYNANNLAVTGGTDIKPERIETYEAGLSWRLKRYFAANANYFYSTIKDQIAQTGSPAVYTNISKTETQGVEVGANGAYGSNIYWKLNYAYQNPIDAITGKRLPYVPSQRASGSVNYALTKYVNLHSDLLWTGQRPRALGDTRSDMPAYTTVDLAATFKNFFKTLEIQATVRNLFDQRYNDPDTSSGSVNVAKNGPKVPGDFPREGISAFVTAKYKF